MSTDFADVAEPRSKGISPVIPAGIATTAVTLFANWWLTKHDTEPMGTYGPFMLPVGAFCVGMFAASGYVVTAWFRGEKITGFLLVSVLVLQCLAYVQAQYTEYRHEDPRFDDGTPVGFLQYFDVVTRNLALKERGAKKLGEPLGVWGYGVRALDVVGFAGGALVILVYLMTSEYCEKCERYMRSRNLVTLASSVPHEKLRRADAEGAQAYLASQKSAEKKCCDMLDSIVGWVEQNDAASILAFIDKWNPLTPQAKKLPARVQVSLMHCPGCANGHLTATHQTGDGKADEGTILWKLEVNPSLVREIVSRRNSAAT